MGIEFLIGFFAGLVAAHFANQAAMNNALLRTAPQLLGSSYDQRGRFLLLTNLKGKIPVSF